MEENYYSKSYNMQKILSLKIDYSLWTLIYLNQYNYLG